MNIIVTGGAGFIGSTLVRALLNRGDHILIVDKDKGKKPNIEQLLEGPNCSVVWQDINRFKPSTDAYDAIFHLAAHADINASYDKPSLDFDNNTKGTLSVLEWMRKYDIPKLVNASSSAVYGESTHTWMENDAKDPINHYGASKLAAETAITGYCHVYGLQAQSFRFGNVVGRRPTRGVTYDFYHKLQDNPETLEILGNGEQRKSFFDVDDCVRALLHISGQETNIIHEAYNIGNGEEITITRLADIVCDELRLNPTYEYTGGRRGWPGDVPIVKLDISKAKSTGWKPLYTCEESLQRTVRWLEKN